MQMMDMMPDRRDAVGSESIAVGWMVHLAISAALGAGYGLIVARLLGSWGSGIAGGVAYGLVWWVLGGADRHAGSSRSTAVQPRLDGVEVADGPHGLRCDPRARWPWRWLAARRDPRRRRDRVDTDLEVLVSANLRSAARTRCALVEQLPDESPARAGVRSPTSTSPGGRPPPGSSAPRCTWPGGGYCHWATRRQRTCAHASRREDHEHARPVSTSGCFVSSTSSRTSTTTRSTGSGSRRR